MKCNSCGNGIFQLFNNTERLTSERDSPNQCSCAGPNITNFLLLFQRSFDKELLFGRSSDVTILNATQVPLLYPDECVTAFSTLYNYSGVCPSRNYCKFDFLFSDMPSESPSNFPSE